MEQANPIMLLKCNLSLSVSCFYISAISDTCLAMEEWVDNPHAATALSSILPCVDQRTTNKTLFQSKEVINDIVNVVNTYIYTFANANPSQTEYNYYNQSGPAMLPLCYPFDSRLQDRECASQEVSMANASVVCLSILSILGCFLKLCFLWKLIIKQKNRWSLIYANKMLRWHIPPILKLENFFKTSAALLFYHADFWLLWFLDMFL